MIQKTAKLMVTLLDQPHICGNNLLAHLFFLESQRYLIALIGAKDGMRILQFNLMAGRRRDMARVKHIVVGRGHNIRPMRLDIAHMGEPRLLTVHLVNEFQCFRGQPRSFAVLLHNIRRFIGIFKDPAAGDILAIHPRIGKISPWIFGLIALGVQVCVIGRAFLVIKAIRPMPPETIVANPCVKSTFRLSCPNDAIDTEPQPFHSNHICLHMGLADQPATHARVAQVIAHRHLPNP